MIFYLCICIFCHSICFFFTHFGIKLLSVLLIFLSTYFVSSYSAFSSFFKFCNKSWNILLIFLIDFITKRQVGYEFFSDLLVRLLCLKLYCGVTKLLSIRIILLAIFIVFTQDFPAYISLNLIFPSFIQSLFSSYCYVYSVSEFCINWHSYNKEN